MERTWLPQYCRHSRLVFSIQPNRAPRGIGSGYPLRSSRSALRADRSILGGDHQLRRRCYQREMPQPSDQRGHGLLGCSVPNFGLTGRPEDNVRFFAGRTCAEEGYDGWIRLEMGVSQGLGDPTAAPFTASDISVNFGYLRWGPDAYFTLVPEPNSLGLFASGLAICGVISRRRRKQTA
jgi:hypothetical protein